MTAVVGAGAGFLVAVLWFDLMHDVMVRGHDSPDLPEPVVAAIAAYYRRVTIDARPMNRLVAAVMVATSGALVVQVVQSGGTAWAPWTALVLAVSAFALAGARTVPAAMRLGLGEGGPAQRSRLARAIWFDHRVCLAAMTALLAIELVFHR